MRRIAIAAVLFLSFACKKPEQPAATTTTATAPPTSSSAATTTQATTPTANADDLLGLAEGAMVVRLPEASESSHAGYFMFDEDTKSTWAGAADKTTNQSIVVQLAGRGT